MLLTVYGVHGVANLRKGLMEHFNKTFFSTYQSASESKLKVIKGHNWTTNTAQVDTEFWLYVLLLMLFPCTEYYRCSSASLCVYGCY